MATIVGQAPPAVANSASVAFSEKPADPAAKNPRTRS
jgi:hypothetical protein